MVYGVLGHTGAGWVMHDAALIKRWRRHAALDSLNDGDVFVLDAGLEIFQWNGTRSGVYEKRRANEVVTQLKEERNGRPKSQVLDGKEECEAFWGKLDGGFGEVASAEDGGSDDDVTKPRPKQLWKLSDADGELKMTKVSEGSDVNPEQLDENDVFIIDDSGVALFVWIGKGASVDEKSTVTSPSDFLSASRK